MINETGKGISVLIPTQPTLDWQTFATWYSVYKNLPEASVAVACIRNKETPYQFFRWAKRLNITYFPMNQISEDNDIQTLYIVRAAFSKGLSEDLCLVLPPHTVVVDVLDENLLQQLSSASEHIWKDNNVWAIKGFDIEKIDETLNRLLLDGEKEFLTSPVTLVREAKLEKSLTPIVGYNKGCGKWIDTLKGCPLSNAAGLVSEEMTVNENRIIELWKKMVALYSVLA